MSLLKRIADAASNGILLHEMQRTNAALERIAESLERLAPIPLPETEPPEEEITIDEYEEEKPHDESEGLDAHLGIHGVAK